MPLDHSNSFAHQRNQKQFRKMQSSSDRMTYPGRPVSPPHPSPICRTRNNGEKITNYLIMAFCFALVLLFIYSLSWTTNILKDGKIRLVDIVFVLFGYIPEVIYINEQVSSKTKCYSICYRE